MIIDYLDCDHAAVSISDRELRLWGTQFEDLCAADSTTQAILHDILTLLEGMGLRRENRQVEIDCVKSKNGCLLLIKVDAALCLRFSSADSLIDAAISGALPDTYCAPELCTDGGYILRLNKALSESGNAPQDKFCP